MVSESIRKMQELSIISKIWLVEKTPIIVLRDGKVVEISPNEIPPNQNVYINNKQTSL